MLNYYFESEVFTRKADSDDIYTRFFQPLLCQTGGRFRPQ